jgi:hypothetical protein
MELRFLSRRWCETDGRTHGPCHFVVCTAVNGTGPRELHRSHGIEMRLLRQAGSMSDKTKTKAQLLEIVYGVDFRKGSA